MLNYMYKSVYDTVKVGDVEQFKSNGRNVPKAKEGDTVTVVGFTDKRERVKVTNGTDTYEVRYSQLKRVAKEMKKLKKSLKIT